MKKFRTWLLYGAFVFVLALIFAYLRFPVETVERFIVARSARLGPQFQTTLEAVEPVFPPGIEIRHLELRRSDHPLFLAERVRVRPKLKTLLGIGRGYRFRIRAHGGEIAGTADLSGSADLPQVRIAARFDGLALGDMPAARLVSESPLQGVLSGRFSYRQGDAGGRQLVAEVRVDDLDVALAQPLLILNRIRIATLQAEAVLNGEELQVRRVTLSGDQLEGRLTGTGVIGRTLQDSRLNLSGKLKPQPAILGETDSNNIGGLLNQVAANGIAVRIRGPLDRLQLTTR